MANIEMLDCKIITIPISKLYEYKQEVNSLSDDKLVAMKFYGENCVLIISNMEYEIGCSFQSKVLIYHVEKTKYYIDNIFELPQNNLLELCNNQIIAIKVGNDKYNLLSKIYVDIEEYHNEILNVFKEIIT